MHQGHPVERVMDALPAGSVYQRMSLEGHFCRQNPHREESSPKHKDSHYLYGGEPDEEDEGINLQTCVKVLKPTVSYNQME